MRVNISYSVELEEVLENAWNLFCREKKKLDDKVLALDSILENQFIDEDLGKISKAIQEYRLNMASFDQKLSEINNILDGYFAIKYNSEPEPDQQETNEIEQENE